MGFDSALRLVSYNILADCYVRVPDQPWNAFSYCREEDILFCERCPRIVASLANSDADIIILQEVMFEYDQADSQWKLPSFLTLPLQDLGYRAAMPAFKQKELCKNAQRNLKCVGKEIPTGLAIFWKCDRFTEFCESTCGSGSGMTLFLQIKNSNAKICANNIHLVGSPSKFSQHLNQLDGVLKQFRSRETFSGAANDFVLEIICGDFNTDVIEKSEDGKFEKTAVGKWFHENGFCRAPTGISWASSTTASRLDHVMFRCKGNTTALELECVRCQPSESPGVNESIVGGLPNKHHPSDHVMLQVEFRLKELDCH